MNAEKISCIFYAKLSRKTL